MKTMYKVIVAMMIMAITTAPVFAGNNVDRKKKPVKKEMVDRRPDRRADRDRGWNHDRHAAVIEVISFKVSPKASKKRNFVAKVEAIHGVKEVKWSPRTKMMTVTYDANKTSARAIKAAVK